jgi:nucleotide-binding universal stress UspA family protein
MNSIRNKEGEMIPQIKRILYATDLSKNSAYAFYFAIDVAQRSEARIILLHVVEPLPPIVRFYGSSDEEKRYYQREKNADLEVIKKRLEEICQRLEKEGTSCLMLVSDMLVRVGHPVEEILKIANEEECDTIILGSHGKGLLKQTFLGSVSHGVLHRSRKPVFVIPIPSEKDMVDWNGI